jgi:hypothetical protein
MELILTGNLRMHRLSANLAYELDLGRNGQDDIANPQAREYNWNLVSLNVLLKL